MQGPARHTGTGMMARLREGVRHAGLLVLAILMIAVAGGFITVAIWMLVAAAWSPLEAALVLAGLYLGLGLLCLVLARPARPHPKASPRAQSPAAGPAAPFPPLTEAFLFGLETAMRLRRPPAAPQDRH
jgi:hypothetical protein